MEHLRYEESENPTPERVQRLIHNLVAYNEQVAPLENRRPLAVFAHDGDELIGGAHGFTHWGWLFVSHLWVSAAARRSGVGTTLMGRLERLARERGAIGAYLDTFDFQARPFYENLGYDLFGQLDDQPVGHVRYYLMKRFG